MGRTLHIVLLLCILNVICHWTESYAAPKRRTSIPCVLLSFDGFRWDYLYRLAELKRNSTFWRLIQDKSRGAVYNRQGMRSSFATLTFPNHHTIATGLHEENHGVIANSMYIDQFNETVYLGHANKKHDLSVLFGGEPIYKTAVAQLGQHKVACYMWIGCDIFNITNHVPYASNVSWSHAVATVSQWLESDVELILLYHQQPDAVGHAHGPDSKAVNETLIRLDNYLDKLMLEIDRLGVGPINLIIVSDHGMTSIKKAVAVPVDSRMFLARKYGASFWFAEPKPGQYDASLAYLRQIAHLTIYEKSQIPAAWYYKNNDRVGAILILANPGYQIVDSESELLNFMAGAHGFDPDTPEMKGIFLASGPAFRKSGSASLSVSDTDIYLLLCTLLQLTPAPNNGTYNVVRSLLEPTFWLSSSGSLVLIFISSFTILFVAILFGLYFWSTYRRSRRQELTTLCFDEAVHASERNPLINALEVETEKEYNT